MHGDIQIRGRKGFTLIELLVVIAIIAVLVGLLLPAVQKVREAANRVKCQNNLKQLSLAAFNYHDVNDAFPAEGIDASCFVSLLPYLEQQALYQQFQVVRIATPGGLGTLAATPLSVLACPSDNIPSPPSVQMPGTDYYFGVSSYRSNVGARSFIDPNWATDGVILSQLVRILDITDGTSNTILFGEFSNFDPNWPQYNLLLPGVFPANIPMSLNASVWTGWRVGYGFLRVSASGYNPLNSNMPVPPPGEDFFTLVYTAIGRFYTFGSGHTGGANFAFCDGSVHFLSNAINNTPGLLSALSTRAGGEVVSLP